METLHITPSSNRRKVELWKDGVKVREFHSLTECAEVMGWDRAYISKALRRDTPLYGYELKSE